MAKLNDLQKKMAVLLLAAPKAADELSKQLNIPILEVNECLKEMVKMKLAKVEGYPPKYKLESSVAEGVRRRKEIQEKDPFELRLKALVEFKAVEETILEKMLKDIGSKLRKEKNLTIYDLIIAKPIKEGTHYSSYIELNFSVADFTTIVQFMYYYGPISVEVIKPQKITLAMDDLQDALMDMAEMIQSYNHAMLRYMAREELDDFAKTLYKPSSD